MHTLFQVDVLKLAFHSESNVDDSGDGRHEVSAKAVGHNIFILAHQVTHVTCFPSFAVLPYTDMEI